MTVAPTDAGVETVIGREGRDGDGTGRDSVGSGRRVADSWSAWMQVPAEEPRGKSHPQTADWTTSPDGRTRTTPARPSGAQFAFEEGPYYRTKETWGAFRMTIQYRTLDRRPVPPRPPPFPHTNQDWSDSGVYIFDHYEVQILDPSRFDSRDDPPGGVPAGAEIRDDPRVRRGGRVVPNNRNRQVPGSVYGVDPPGRRYINWANKTGEWNTLVIEFQPPSLDPADRTVIMRAARIKTVLNGHLVFEGAITDSDGRPLNGTGVRRNDTTPATRGCIYLQSHWGSQVEFRDPVIKESGAGTPEEVGNAQGWKKGHH
jgi:hypothetical protein